MKKIKLYDFSFNHQKGMSKCSDPTTFKWYRGLNSFGDTNIIVYTDLALNLVDVSAENSFKVALLVEPDVIYPQSYEYIKRNINKFDLILTHQKEFCKLSDKIKWYPFGGTWIEGEDRKIYSKSKNISTIASNKNYAVGHKLRHKVINEFCGKFDVYGYGYNIPLDYKLDALKDYKFSISIENCQNSGYFTEKLLDCFVTGTVPIYCGSRDTLSLFNQDGIFYFETLQQLSSILNDIVQYPNIYEQKCIKAINDNLEIAKQYLSPEDWIYKNIFQAMLV